MQCPTPLSITDKSENNPQGRASKQISVPCGKCGICKKNNRTQWSFRLREELKDATNCKFLTLTYSEDNLPFNEQTGEISLNKKHAQDFIKRLREYDYRKTGKRNLRFYAVGEYGSRTQRPHLHIIIFNLSKSSINNLPNLWGFGHTHIGHVSPASIHYVTKYHVNRKNTQSDETRQPEFTLQSKGLGRGYIERNRKYHEDTGYTFTYIDGHPINLPRYFKEQIFYPETAKAKRRIKKLELLPRTPKNVGKLYDNLDIINFEKVQKDLYSERNLCKAYSLEKQEAQRLTKLGYQDPYKEMQKRAIHKSQKIIHKSQEQDIL